MPRAHPFQMLKKKKRTAADINKRVERVLRHARNDPRHQAARERDALITAIRHGHTEIAQRLLAEGVDSNVPDSKQRTALWYAANYVSGQGSLVRELVRKGATLPDDVLMGPVHDGDVETVRFLIRHGANVNCVAAFTRYSNKFPQKEILLTEAIRKIPLTKDVERLARSVRSLMTARRQAKHRPALPHGDLEAIPLTLIKSGANVNRLAFEYSIYEGFIRTILGLAAHQGLVRTVKAMLAAGADVNQKDTWGGTALFDAAHEGHMQVAKVLLAAGAATNIKRRDCATPISIARERGFPELADLIQNYKTRS